jgi:hypothetical protein
VKGVAAHPNAEWLARQLTEACGWDEPPRYLIRDRHGPYGAAFIRRIRAVGTRDRPVSAPRSLIVPKILQRDQNARAFVANLGRATPSICSSLSFRPGEGVASDRSLLVS